MKFKVGDIIKFDNLLYSGHHLLLYVDDLYEITHVRKSRSNYFSKDQLIKVKGNNRWYSSNHFYQDKQCKFKTELNRLIE